MKLWPQWPQVYYFRNGHRFKWDFSTKWKFSGISTEWVQVRQYDLSLHTMRSKYFNQNWTSISDTRVLKQPQYAWLQRSSVRGTQHLTDASKVARRWALDVLLTWPYFAVLCWFFWHRVDLCIYQILFRMYINSYIFTCALGNTTLMPERRIVPSSSISSPWASVGSDSSANLTNDAMVAKNPTTRAPWTIAKRICVLYIICILLGCRPISWLLSPARIYYVGR